MLKAGLFFLLVVMFSFKVQAFSSTSGICEINANYDNMTMNRTKNNSPGSYNVTLNSPYYSQNDAVEITLSGLEFTGLVFTVVDENGSNVGIFQAENNVVHECGGSFQPTPPAAAVTHHSNFGSMTSYTLFWIPPTTNAGKVYILGYVLKGARGVTGSQEFFRFVRDDSSAISINARDVFSDNFE